VAWVPAVPALHQASPERPSHVDVPSRADIVLSQGLVPLEGFAWHGCPRCLLYFKQARAAFSRRCPFEGCYRLEPRARAARGFCVAWVPVVPALLQAGPGRPSHADVPSRAAFVSSQGSAPLEGSPCLARDRVIKCLTVEAAVLQRGRAFLGVAAARTRVVGSVADGRDRSPRFLQVFAVMMALPR
jgi:hypothetical protein